jgi:hypothetical protein
MLVRLVNERRSREIWGSASFEKAFIAFSPWGVRSAPSLPSTLEISKDCCARATQIPRTPEIRSGSSSHHNRSQCATTNTGCATVPAGGLSSHPTESAAIAASGDDNPGLARHPETSAFCEVKDPGELRDAWRPLRRNNRASGSLPHSPTHPHAKIPSLLSILPCLTPTHA